MVNNIKKVGQVVGILNSKFAIIKTTEPLIIGSEIIVFAEKESSIDGLQMIMIPKGKLKVVMIQNNNFYIVSVITKGIAINSPSNVNLAKVLSAFSIIFGEDLGASASEIEDNIANYSALLDESQSLNVVYDKKVKVGDSVGFSSNDIVSVVNNN